MTFSYTPQPKKRDLAALQKFQEVHDERFHQDIHRLAQDEQIRHIAHHLAKIAGRFGDYFDKLDHAEERKDAQKVLSELEERRTPDLLVFALMLASRLELDLEQSYFKRIAAVEKRKMK